MFSETYQDTYQPAKDKLNEFGYELVEFSGNILANRRKELGMTQQQVADAAKILLRQYQRFESNERDLASSSFRIGMKICRALQLDPHRFA